MCMYLNKCIVQFHIVFYNVFIYVVLYYIFIYILK